MKKSLFTNLMLIILALSIFSCRDEIDIDEVTEIEINIPNENIVSNVYGRVVDVNDDPVAETIVLLDNEMTATDEDGFFFFNDISMNGYGQLLKFEKEGYFLGAKIFEPSADARSFVRCKLMTKESSGSISSAVGGEIKSNGNSSVIFTANSFVDANGDAYTGEVEVYTRWMDPSARETLLEMPGDLRAVDQSSNIVQLASYGMMAIELEGSNGQELNIAENMTAELKFEVPTDLSGNAPNTIPLWSFNEQHGYWIEEGIASLINGQYVGDVSHFSFWNCDVDFPLVELSGTVVDVSGRFLEGYQVTIGLGLLDTLFTGCAWTDDGGNFGGKVPLGEELVIRVYDQCGEEIYSEQIGPFTANVILPPIVVPDNGTNNVLFSGYLNDCNGQAVTNGYVKVILSSQLSQLMFVDGNGYFSKLVNVCSATTVDYQGIDFENTMQSSLTTIDLVGNDMNLGTVLACDELESYFSYTYGSTTEYMNESILQFGIDDESLFISGINADIDAYSTIQVFPTNGVGTYNPEYIILFNSEEEVITCNAGATFDCLDIDIIFTVLDFVVGGRVEATFSGMAEIDGMMGPLSGAFKGQIK